MSDWKRRLTRLAVAVAVLLLLGATVQGVTTALERQRLTRPGQMVEAGGHQLHLRCTGEGGPAVILDAAALSTTAEWAWVQLDVSRLTRVCSFDRSGLGYSEAADAPYDPARAPDELHAALARADVSRPYVLAGHGLGAAFAEIYAGRYRSELAGLVLVDPPSPGRFTTMSPGARARLSTFTRRLHAMPWIARFGLLRLYNPLAPLATGLPEPQSGELRMFLVTPDHLARSAREVAALDQTLKLAGEVGGLAGLPVSVISASQSGNGELDEIFLDHASVEAARLSPASTRREVPGATDRTILTDPASAAQVAGAIRALVQGIRSEPAPLP